MTKDSRLARRALHKNTAAMIPILAQTRGFQLATPTQLKAGARQLCKRFISNRRKELRAEALLEEQELANDN